MSGEGVKPTIDTKLAAFETEVAEFRESPYAHCLEPAPWMGLEEADPEVFTLIYAETIRRIKTLDLIASENLPHPDVLAPNLSVLTGKYAEGYPPYGRDGSKGRFYAGNEVVDVLELLAERRAREAFGLTQEDWHVNTQPYSGTPANFAVDLALLDPKFPSRDGVVDAERKTVMGLSLDQGGHLSHGQPVSATGIVFDSVLYGVDEDGRIDFEEFERLVEEHKPKVIWAGATAYVHEYDYERFADIAHKNDAYLVVDMAHLAGLVAAGAHPSPFEGGADVVTTTTQKTLQGDRGGLIFCRKGLPSQIDRAVFPQNQGGPHLNTIASHAVALGRAAKPEFSEYGHQIVHNAQALAEALKREGFGLVGDGTENHLMLLDLKDRGYSGRHLQDALEMAGIVTNKNAIPNDPLPPYYTSGLRVGTPDATNRGMSQVDMAQVAQWIARVDKVIGNVPGLDYGNFKSWISGGAEFEAQRKGANRAFREFIDQSPELAAIKDEVAQVCLRLPIPGVFTPQ